jgi:hypothetical protein
VAIRYTSNGLHAAAKALLPPLALGTFRPDREHEKRLPCDAELRRWHKSFGPTMKASYEESTRRAIEKHLAPYFGNRDLREIREADLLGFVQFKMKAKLAPNTIRNSLEISDAATGHVSR